MAHLDSMDNFQADYVINMRAQNDIEWHFALPALVKREWLLDVCNARGTITVYKRVKPAFGGYLRSHRYDCELWRVF